MPTVAPTSIPNIVATYKFDFGTDTAVDGYTAVTTDTVYDMSKNDAVEGYHGFLGITEDSYANDVLGYACDNRAIDGFTLVKGQQLSLMLLMKKAKLRCLRSVVDHYCLIINGYEFAGWYDGNKKIASSSQYVVRVRENINLTARFESAIDEPNMIKWTFSPYGDSPVIVSGTTTEDYKGAVFHMNSGDSLTGNGLAWKSPGGTKSESTTVVSNNRYIEFTPEKSGIISITFAGNDVKGSNFPRMYISAGNDIYCMTKESNSSQLESNKSFDNKKGAGTYDTMSTDLTGGVKYYIWAYYYGRSEIGFTISEIKYEVIE